jgi:hypothetical protein
MKFHKQSLEVVSFYFSYNEAETETNASPLPSFLMAPLPYHSEYLGSLTFCSENQIKDDN